MRIASFVAPTALVIAAAVLALGIHTEDGSSQWMAGQPSSITCQGGQPRTIFSENFETFDEAFWVVGNDAAWEPGSGQFFLTTADPELSGRLFFGTRLSGCGFRAEFDYEISGGTGADGLTLAVAQSTDYDSSFGGGLDFCPGDDGGFAAEFDTFANGGTDPPGQHVGIIADCPDNHLASALTTVRGEHHAVVDFVQGRFTIYLDGGVVLSHTFPGMTFFDGFIGVTAATGGATDNHIVDNFSVSVVNPLQGDLNCSGAVTGLDALLALLYLQELPAEIATCPPLDVELLGGFLFGDVNCDGAIDIDDAMAIVTFAAGFEPLQEDGCVAVGGPL